MFHVCPQNLILISSVRIKDLSRSSITLGALFWVRLHREQMNLRAYLRLLQEVEQPQSFETQRLCWRRVSLRAPCEPHRRGTLSQRGQSSWETGRHASPSATQVTTITMDSFCWWKQTFCTFRLSKRCILGHPLKTAPRYEDVRSGKSPSHESEGSRKGHISFSMVLGDLWTAGVPGRSSHETRCSQLMRKVSSGPPAVVDPRPRERPSVIIGCSGGAPNSEGRGGIAKIEKL